MEKVTYYRCGVCRKIYDRKSEAMECEKYHTCIKQIESCNYLSLAEDMGTYGSYPKIISVEMEDGKIVQYKRME